jgi:trehalose-phosphatase
LTERLAHIPGLIIEPKGITASIHVRNVEPPLHPRVEDEILREIEENDDLLVVATGRMILEIKPRVNWGKGKALSHIVGRLVREDSTPPLVSFIGDDRTDEDAFIAFPDGLSVRIRSGRETPRRTAARYEVESQDRVPAYFQWLLEALTHRADDSKRSLTQQ